MKSSRDKLESAARRESTPAAAGYAISTSRTGASDRKSYFARLLEALHDSRRLQAMRVIRHYETNT
jgi:hypothetical protein